MMLGGDKMYKKVIRGTRYYEVEPKISLALTYYMIEKTIDSGKKYYGIEIEQKKVSHQVNPEINVDRIMLSECKEWMEVVIGKLIGGGVTPVTMECVIDELI